MTVRDVLDLFCGMGGLSYGFVTAGFKVTGIDIDSAACETYSLNRIGKSVQMDITKEKIRERFDILIGGPPCEPWSTLNLHRRGKKHPLHRCLRSFFTTAIQVEPDIFLLENVPTIRSDPEFVRGLSRMAGKGYHVSYRIIRYSDYGAPIARKRLFMLGVKKELMVIPSEVFDGIPLTPWKTVREAIADLSDMGMNPTFEHVWPRVKTIEKYLRYYRTGKYGWYVLEWDKPAPSFGNITKTYILHPASFNGGVTRPISVREALRLMNFPDSYIFPSNISLARKYEMVAESVSPIFSAVLALAIKKVL